MIRAVAGVVVETAGVYYIVMLEPRDFKSVKAMTRLGAFVLKQEKGICAICMYNIGNTFDFRILGGMFDVPFPKFSEAWDIIKEAICLKRNA